jgi:sugar phosphate isomerase/epimerase
MIYGAITNSWRNHLDDNELGDLIAEAQSRGARHIELRQTCLAAGESGEGDAWRPNLETLANVVVRFPDLTFDLAVALPCITNDIDPQGGLYQSQLEAARLVGGDRPHLRTVDPGTTDTPWQSSADVAEPAARIVPLVREAARQGVIFSMENSGQPLRSMALLVQEARDQLTEVEGQYLGLCPDPTNQLRRHPDSQPLDELASLPTDYIKIVHFKQARDGVALGSVDDGDLDCHAMVRILEGKAYDGPAVMEIPSADDVFDNLAASFAYLDG